MICEQPGFSKEHIVPSVISAKGYGIILLKCEVLGIMLHCLCCFLCLFHENGEAMHTFLPTSTRPGYNYVAVSLFLGRSLGRNVQNVKNKIKNKIKT